ncbi:MAG TPA: XrtA/PEP-CTERM system exopolysaccharide export protein [Burkholderiaceae bacterium]|nr:XrtA/PEP-CTERM system exopolysaccharide export protein [Burkholderiaceae bacterium]
MHPRAATWPLAALAWACLLSACSNLPDAPAKAPIAAHKYVIGPLDTITVTVWRNPELSVTTQVRPDGRISTPLVEDLPALGKTPSELAHDVQQALEKFVRDPIVSIGVNGFQGPYTEQIRVIGEAAKPQVIAYRQNMTLLDVMIQVGGLTDYADGNGAILVRGAEDGKQYRVHLKDLVKGGKIEANVEVMPGDVLIIPQSYF